MGDHSRVYRDLSEVSGSWNVYGAVRFQSEPRARCSLTLR